MRILDQSIAYRNESKYAAFPSLARNEETLYLAFRVAPNVKPLSHLDTRSYALILQSADEGRTWQNHSEVTGRMGEGIQDPSLSVLKGCLPDYTTRLFLSYFVWRSKSGVNTRKAKKALVDGIYIRTTPVGETEWSEPVKVPGDSALRWATSEPFGGDASGYVYLAGYGNVGGGGDCCIVFTSYWPRSWTATRIAFDPTGTIDYQEPAILDCGDQHLLCVVRGPNHTLYQVHNWERGEPWEPTRKMPFGGTSPSLCRLADGRVLCTYGYRKPPYGIRACLSWNEGVSWEYEDIFVLRTDGGGWDLGYPSTVQMADGSLLTAYYFHTKQDRLRRIELTRWTID